TTTGRPYLRAAVTQAAGAASHTTNTGLAAPSHRLSRRMGNNKALVAVRHSLLVILSQVLLGGRIMANAAATTSTVSNRSRDLRILLLSAKV
ncbi:MAG: hypothetical protein H0T45_19590, partial [Pyrinomonadaceae bacterium]|nr:hypothetical protein [Pyrinomonadaceae bacterium]